MAKFTLSSVKLEGKELVCTYCDLGDAPYKYVSSFTDTKYTGGPVYLYYDSDCCTGRTCCGEQEAVQEEPAKDHIEDKTELIIEAFNKYIGPIFSPNKTILVYYNREKNRAYLNLSTTEYSKKYTFYLTDGRLIKKVPSIVQNPALLSLCMLFFKYTGCDLFLWDEDVENYKDSDLILELDPYTIEQKVL